MLVGNILQGPDRTHYLLDWIRQSFHLPHCIKTQSMASLRTGIAMAEVLAMRIPTSCHHLFLPTIETCNLNPEKCIQNLAVILKTIRVCYEANKEAMNLFKLNQFTAEGLYYEEWMMENFGINVLMNLEKFDCKQRGKLSNSIEEMSEITVEMPRLPRMNTQHESSSYEVAFKNGELNFIADNECTSTKQRLRQRMEDTYGLRTEGVAQHEIMAELVNGIFANIRTGPSEKILKPVHCEMGPIVVYRRVAEFLTGVERMRKDNILELASDIELGFIRENVFWGVITDLFAFRDGKNPSRVLSSSKSQKRRSPNRRSPNRKALAQIRINTNSTEEESKTKRKEVSPLLPPLYSTQMIITAEKWITDQLGYGHSLRRSKQEQERQCNPLLNGVLMGSIIMRLQICKLSIIKEPTPKQAEANIKLIANELTKRGYEAGRLLFIYAATYNFYLGLLWDIKIQLEVKDKHHRLRIDSDLKDRKQPLKRKLYLQDKEKLREWLQQKQLTIESFPKLSVSKFVEICAQLLSVSLYKETTVKIKEGNAGKVIEQLRRIGLREYLSVDVGQVTGDSDEVRWAILGDIFDLTWEQVHYIKN